MQRLLKQALVAAAAVTAFQVDTLAEEIVVGQTFIADGTDPANGSVGWALTSHGVGENLFTVDQDGHVVPLLAESATPDGDSWIVRLQPERYFADGTLVTAADAAASLGRTNEQNAAAQASLGRAQFEVIDEQTLRITPERPVPVMASVLAEWPLVVYKLTDGEPVFSGPYEIAKVNPGDSLSLRPNAFYAGAASRPDILLKRFADPQSLALAFETGELDLAFNLPAEAADGLRSRGFTVRSFPVAYQYMMWMNTRVPHLADGAVRRALDLAIDRDLLVRAVNGGQPATGAFASFFPFAPETPRPHDPAKAAALLDAAGWIENGDKVRVKDGRPLNVTLTAYPQRPDLLTFLPVIKAMLADVGVGVETRVSEAVTQVATSGDFDLLLWAQHSAPAGDPSFFLNMFLRSGAGNNHSGYSSPRYDALLDGFDKLADPAERTSLAMEAQEILFEDAPVAFLTTPEWHVGVSERLAHYKVWGSDYYVIRPDLTLAP